MKVCKRYLDFLEEQDSPTESPLWQDIMAHASKCPDCSIAMQARAEMLEAMNEFPEPEYPESLHERIMTEISADNAGTTEFVWFDKLMEVFLRPLELSFTVACVLMIFFLWGPEKSEHQFPQRIGKKPIIVAQKAPVDAKVQPGSQIQGLDAVSREEVKQFLAKLEKFNRNRSAKDQQLEPDKFMPELSLVNDW